MKFIKYLFKSKEEKYREKLLNMDNRGRIQFMIKDSIRNNSPSLIIDDDYILVIEVNLELEHIRTRIVYDNKTTRFNESPIDVNVDTIYQMIFIKESRKEKLEKLKNIL